QSEPEYLCSNSGLIEPKKLPNPVRESKTHQELHRELLMAWIAIWFEV
uniref:Uncharacterized protein n=1 Tax=Chelonoidis abingdonii TaxID=106734 RepID=A0A8C0HGA9_CHEAB